MSYEQGFMDKCAAVGADGAELVKLAGGWSAVKGFLRGAVSGPRHMLGSGKAREGIRRLHDSAQRSTLGKANANNEALDALFRQGNQARESIGRKPLGLMDQMAWWGKQSPTASAQDWAGILDHGVSNSEQLGEILSRLGLVGGGLAGAGYGASKLYDRVADHEA